MATLRGNIRARIGDGGVSGFSAEWLALREPFDLRARNSAVLEAVSTSLKARAWVRVVDLASGTGSTLRALSPHLPARQSWKLIDNDAALLKQAIAPPLDKDLVVSAETLDLSRDLAAALEQPADLVTMSALLDLVSEPWLDEFAAAIAARSIPVYAALSYDGRTSFDPADSSDAAVTDAVNAHQRTDKGFGAALGPAAAAFAISRFEAVGYSVVSGEADWAIGREDRYMQIELLGGWANAAKETNALSLDETDAWLARRRSAVAAGRSSIHVGHVDFFATPNARR
jgi:hypothetical protein